MGVRGGGGAAGMAATVGMATGTETSKVSPGLRFSGITTFILCGERLDARRRFFETRRRSQLAIDVVLDRVAG